MESKTLSYIETILCYLISRPKVSCIFIKIRALLYTSVLWPIFTECRSQYTYVEQNKIVAISKKHESRNSVRGQNIADETRRYNKLRADIRNLISWAWETLLKLQTGRWHGPSLAANNCEPGKYCFCSHRETQVTSNEISYMKLSLTGHCH